MTVIINAYKDDSPFGAESGAGARARSDIRAKSVRAMLLSSELERARLNKGLTTRDLAALLGTSPARVNRTTNGRRIPALAEVAEMCAILDVPHVRRQHLYNLASQTEEANWLIHSIAGEPDPGGVVRSLWSLADRVLTYTTTASGPRVLGNANIATEAEIPGRNGSLRWTHFMPAHVLSLPLDGRGKRLRRLAHLDVIQIVPIHAPLLLRHPIQIFTFRRCLPVAVCDLESTIVVLEGRHATEYVSRMEYIQQNALPVRESRRLVEGAWGPLDL